MARYKYYCLIAVFLFLSGMFWLTRDVSLFWQQKDLLLSLEEQKGKLQKYLAEKPLARTNMQEELESTWDSLLAERLVLISMQNNEQEQGKKAYLLSGNYLELLRFLKSYASLAQGFLITELQISAEKELLQIEIVLQNCAVLREV